jgi:hypothetical protein
MTGTIVAGSLMLTVSFQRKQHLPENVIALGTNATCFGGIAKAEIDPASMTQMSIRTWLLFTFKNGFMAIFLEPAVSNFVCAIYLLLGDGLDFRRAHTSRERGHIVRQLRVLANSGGM